MMLNEFCWPFLNLIEFRDLSPMVRSIQKLCGPYWFDGPHQQSREKNLLLQLAPTGGPSKSVIWNPSGTPPGISWGRWECRSLPSTQTSLFSACLWIAELCWVRWSADWDASSSDQKWNVCQKGHSNATVPATSWLHHPRQPLRVRSEETRP